MHVKDKVILDIKDNKELADYFGRKGVGSECEMEVKGMVDEITDDQAVLSIKQVGLSEEYSEPEPMDDAEVSPVMVVMAGKKY